MNLIYSAEELDFAKSIQSWVQENLDPKVRDKMMKGGLVTWEEKVSWWKTTPNQSESLNKLYPPKKGPPLAGFFICF